MAKLIKKDKCEFINGSIIKKNKQIGISKTVWLQLHKLEHMVQAHEHLCSQAPYSPGPTLDDFEVKSALKKDRPHVEPLETPVMNKRVKEAMAFMEEVDNISKAEEINQCIDRFGELFDWVNSDTFIEGNCVAPIDLYILGNPLELTEEQLMMYIINIIDDPVKLG